jgi:hypothetical protein
MYLYDCSSGQCFSYDFRMPADVSQVITVRAPKPGKWIVLINAAPMLIGKGGFTFESIVAGPTSTKPIPASGAVAVDRSTSSGVKGRIQFMEVIDQAGEEEEQKYPLLGESAKKLKTRPVSLATATYPLP